MRGLLRLRSLFFSVFFVFLLVMQGMGEEQNKYYKDKDKEEQKQKAMGYYKDERKRGWWWYEDPIKKEEVEKKKEVKKEEVIKEEQKREKVKREEPKKEEEEIKPLHEYSYEELLRMPVDKFKKIYEYYENLAVSNPTEENLYYFYNILDVARKKALLFTTQAMYVWQKYPELSTAKDFPTTLPGLTVKQEMISQEVNSYVNSKRGEYGLIVFVSERCPYCKVQMNIIRNFIEKYGWEVKVVDIDYDKRAIAQFGIETVPSIILVSKKMGEWFPLASGVISVVEIKERIYLAIRKIEGDLQPERWGMYKFQEGTSLDPLKPSPLWDKENKNKPGKIKQEREGK
jgi:conjugal transfer pilus assembly protein TraF